MDVINNLYSGLGLGYLLPFVFVLTIVVFFHELGHFYIARRCGVRVEVFSVGFGRAIAKWHDKHGTEWRISWIPLGGYVKFFGDENAASAPSADALNDMDDAGRQVARPAAFQRVQLARDQVAKARRDLIALAGNLAVQRAPLGAAEVIAPRARKAGAGKMHTRHGFAELGGAFTTGWIYGLVATSRSTCRTLGAAPERRAFRRLTSVPLARPPEGSTAKSCESLKFEMEPPVRRS